uniref:Uncharacterized protein n=1 Tax=Arundo donax TaxID=35708 RepID=A0A0A9F8M8_ARUDO
MQKNATQRKITPLATRTTIQRALCSML